MPGWAAWAGRGGVGRGGISICGGGGKWESRGSRVEEWRGREKANFIFWSSRVRVKDHYTTLYAVLHQEMNATVQNGVTMSAIYRTKMSQIKRINTRSFSFDGL